MAPGMKASKVAPPMLAVVTLPMIAAKVEVPRHGQDARPGTTHEVLDAFMLVHEEHFRPAVLVADRGRPLADEREHAHRICLLYTSPSPRDS